MDLFKSTKNLKQKCCGLWLKFNPFGVSDLIQSIIKNFEEVDSRLEKVQTGIESELYSVKKDLEFVEIMLQVVSDTTTDMLWIKDVEGKYIFVNSNARTKLFSCNNPLGQKDCEINHKIVGIKRTAKRKIHTFLEFFEETDNNIIRNLSTQRFIETGKVNGKEVTLEIFKSPVFLDNKLIGICSAGRFV